MWPAVTKVAAECHVRKDFVVKIECKLMENSRVLLQEEIWLMLIPVDRNQGSLKNKSSLII
jgi:hypothetical protein